MNVRIGLDMSRGWNLPVLGGKKELAACCILDALGICHVSYEEVPEQKLKALADEKYQNKIKDAGENVVKSKILTSEKRSIVSWEAFQMYCAYREEDEFSYVKSKYPQAYYSMQIADYILGNEDRHGANWGFLWIMIPESLGSYTL